jgi:WD40 repeat protein
MLNRQISCRTLLLVAVALVVVIGLALLALVGWLLPWRERVALEASTTPVLGIPTLASPVSGTPAPDVPVSLDPTPSPYWDRVYVEYILDASGSMLDKMDGERKIDVAKEVLAAKAGQLPTTTNVGLRVYGHRVHYSDKEKSCQDIELLVPPVRGGRDRVLEKLPTLEAQGMTPLSEAVIQSVDDFDHKDPFRHNSLVVISDGEETCGGDPCTMADDLVNVYGIRFTMYVIGFDILDNPTAQQQLRCLADKTGGVYVDANNRDELARALDGMWQAIDQQAADAYQEQQPPSTEVAATGPTDKTTPLPPTETPAVDSAPTPMYLPDNLLPITTENISQVVEIGRLGKGIVGGVAYSPDGRLLAVVSSRGVHFYDAETLEEVCLIESNAWVYSLAFSPDGATLASGAADGTVQLWRVEDGTLLRTLKGHTNSVESLAFSPDGATLASGSWDGTVRLWQVSDGTSLHTLGERAFYPVWGLAFSPDGSILMSGTSDGTVRLWQVSDGTVQRTVEMDDGYAKSWQSKSVTFSPDGAMLAARAGKEVQLWQVSDGTLLHTLEGHTNSVESVAFSPDGAMLASGSWDNTVRLWRASDGTPLRTLDANSVENVVFAPDGATLAVATWEEVRLWRVSDGALLRTLEGHTSSVESVTFSPDGTTLASGSRDSIVRLWQVSDGTLLHTLEGHKGRVEGVAFSPDGATLASGAGDGTVRLWRVSDGMLLRTLEKPPPGVYPVYSVAFSPDGATLASGEHGARTNVADSVRLWRVSDGMPLGTLGEQHTNAVYYSVAFSPDGATLASGAGDGTVRLWRVADGMLLHTLEGHTNSVESVTFSPDGATLVSGSQDSTVRMWRVSDGMPLRTLEEHTNTVYGVAFSPDGAILASGSWDGTVRLWRVSDGMPLRTIEGVIVSSVAFSSDGALLASGSWDGTVWLWGIPGEVGQASPATVTPSPTAPTSEHQPGDTHTRAKDGMQMVYVPAGEFLMGSTDADSDASDDEKPQHTVYLDAFWIDKTEVSRSQFHMCVNSGMCQTPMTCEHDSIVYDYDTFAEFPMTCVDWNQAQSYCQWVGARLPTEAEWEKAARGTDGRKYAWGNSAPDDNKANYNSRTDNLCVGFSSKVGSYPTGASPYGALDIAGNVWEWCADWYDRDYYSSSPTNNPTGPYSNDKKVLRGGDWCSNPRDIRAARRDYTYPDARSMHLGFRCVMPASESP